MTQLLIKLGIIRHSIESLKQGGDTILANIFRRRKFFLFGPPVVKIEKIGNFNADQRIYTLPL